MKPHINKIEGGCITPLLVFGSLQAHHATANVNGVCPTIACTDFGLPRIVGTTEINDNMKKYRIRKLTPKECFRLMGLHDDQIKKIQDAGISESQQYKMAGNSIVVDCLEGIFHQMFKAEKDTIF